MSRTTDFKYGYLYGRLEGFYDALNGDLSLDEFVNELNQHCRITLDTNSLKELCEIFCDEIKTTTYNDISYVIVGDTDDKDYFLGIAYLDKNFVKIVEDKELIENIIIKRYTLYEVRLLEKDDIEGHNPDFHEYNGKWQWDTLEQAMEAFNDALKKGHQFANKAVLTLTEVKDGIQREYTVIVESDF